MCGHPSLAVQALPTLGLPLSGHLLTLLEFHHSTPGHEQEPKPARWMDGERRKGHRRLEKQHGEERGARKGAEYVGNGFVWLKLRASARR